jgi:hypothetical protein
MQSRLPFLKKKSHLFSPLLGASFSDKLDKGKTQRQPNSSRLISGLYTRAIISVVCLNWKWKVSLLQAEASYREGA